MSKAKTFVGSFALLAGLPSVALAHPGIGDATGFMHGLSHPLSGLDHILAMTLVGVIAYQLGGRARWLVPTTFVLVMALGGALGVQGVTVPFVEVGIALSVVVLGAIVALRVTLPMAAAAALVGMFAIFHGYAHAAEMPESASGAAYAAGFMIATGLLHIAGIAVSYAIDSRIRRGGHFVMQSAGTFAALAGVMMITRMM